MSWWPACFAHDQMILNQIQRGQFQCAFNLSRRQRKPSLFRGYPGGNPRGSQPKAVGSPHPMYYAIPCRGGAKDPVEED